MKHIDIHTDGACSGNQNDTNVGGWGAVLEYGPHRKELFGGESNTTNNRMEMKALLNALQAVKRDRQTIRVFSDSSYLMNCFRDKWYVNWRQNNWKTGKKTDVENRDLWEALLEFIDRHDIRFYRVKGHVDLKSPRTDVDKLYRTFVEWNGDVFTLDDFRHVTEMNNLADTLANRGIDAVRDSDPDDDASTL